MKYKATFLAISVIVLGFLTFLLYKDNFMNSILVETKNVDGNVHKYYEINSRMYKKEVGKFKTNSLSYGITNECFKSKSKTKDNDKLSVNKCRVIDDNNKDARMREEIKRIIKLLSKSKEEIIKAKVFKAKQDYYVVVGYNTNYHTPYKLYKYNYKKNTLGLIYTFDNEEVIGIKYKE